MAFVSYIIKSGIILIVLWVYYEIILKRQTSFKLNRFYLLGSLLFAAGIPLIHISYPFFEEVPSIILLSPPLANTLIDTEINTTPPLHILWSQYLIYSYLCGVLFFSVRYLHFWYQIFKLSSILPHKKIQGLHIHLLPSSMPTFSVFHHLFFNPQGLDKKSRRKIFEHEKIHIRQWHSLDIQISEIICIVNWFNPLVWIFKRSILQNHEYLADQGVIQQFQASSYVQLLVYQTLKGNTSFRNYFSCSHLKQRVKMMTRATSLKSKSLNYVPILLIGSILFFCSTSIAIGTTESALSSTSPVVRGQRFSSLFPLQTPERKDSGNARKRMHQPIKYPAETVEKKFTDDPYVPFTTDEKDKIDCNILQGLTTPLSTEALRTVQNTPEGSSSPSSIPLLFRHSSALSSGTSLSGEKAFSQVTEMPQFGEDVLEWVSKHIRYPAEAQTAGYKSKIHVHFIVDKNGNVTEVELIRKSPYEVLNQEVLRVIKSMPKWESPGKIGDRPVNVSYTLPINFA